jgi:CRISPR-associated protein Cmr6
MRKPILQLSDIGGKPQPRAKDRRRRPGRGHPGLLLQRFLACPAEGTEFAAAEKRALLRAAVQCASQSDSLQAVYAAAYARWNASFRDDELNPSEELRTEGRLIVGLGAENVLETGIRLHHTYGVPLVPGSALKGLASHYCHEVWGQGKKADGVAQDNEPFRRNGDFHRIAFGATDDGGVITFHDAWISPDSLKNGALRLDVMTPHHPKWQTNEAPPTDFDSPVPVSFLSVAGTFQVRLSWSGPAGTPPERARDWTHRALRLLREALAEWGVGGKTSSGYGRLVDANAPPLAPSPALAGSATTVQRAVRPEADPDKVTVKVLERREVGGKVQFLVQEEGRPRGVLGYGNPPPPDELPQVGGTIKVYRNNRDPRSPQYRWDKPATTPPGKPKGGPGGQRPGGRR